VRVGRVRVFGEFLAVFNCSVLTFWSAIKFHRGIEPTSTLHTYIQGLCQYMFCEAGQALSYLACAMTTGSLLNGRTPDRSRV
jgi:hypothetical protein